MAESSAAAAAVAASADSEAAAKAAKAKILGKLGCPLSVLLARNYSELD